MAGPEAIHVLIVEDDHDLAYSLKMILEGREEVTFTTEWARTVASAIERLKADEAGRIEVVMLDLHMPDGRGPKVVERIKAAARHVRTIVYTGWSDPENTAGARLAGADEVLVKPSDPLTIVKVLQWQVIHKRTKLDQERMEKTLKEIGVAMKQSIDNPCP